MHRIFYLAQKELQQLIRNTVFLRLIFIVPFIQIVIMGFAITTDIRNVPVTVVDLDHSAFSRRLLDAFTITESFRFLGISEDEEDVKSLMDFGKIKLALVIPYHFERDLKSNRNPQVQAILEGVNGNTAGIVMGYVSEIAANLRREWLKEAGIPGQNESGSQATGIEIRMMYNIQMESVNNIVPGILVLLIMVVTSFLTGMGIVREKEMGTLEQLMVTPIRNMELILGKVIPLILVAFILLNIGIIAAGLIFGIWIKGNLLTLYIMSFFFSLSTLGLGIFASTLAKTQQQAMFITWFFMIFAILLSGFFIPIDNMPVPVQVITYLNPVRYFMAVIREIYLKGTGFNYLWKEGLYMIIFGFSTFIFAATHFHKRLG